MSIRSISHLLDKIEVAGWLLVIRLRIEWHSLLRLLFLRWLDRIQLSLVRCHILLEDSLGFAFLGLRCRGWPGRISQRRKTCLFLDIGQIRWSDLRQQSGVVCICPPCVIRLVLRSLVEALLLSTRSIHQGLGWL